MINKSVIITVLNIEIYLENNYLQVFIFVEILLNFPRLT